MKIKISPENDMEKQRIKEVVHTGVQDFFIVGNKKNDEEFEDFHDWKGSYKFLIGNLYYYLNHITEEQNGKNKAKFSDNEIDIKPASAKKPMFKVGDTSDLKVIDTKEIESNVKEQNTVQFSPPPIPPPPYANQNNDEFAAQPEIVENESKAEDENTSK